MSSQDASRRRKLTSRNRPEAGGGSAGAGVSAGGAGMTAAPVSKGSDRHAALSGLLLGLCAASAAGWETGRRVDAQGWQCDSRFEGRIIQPAPSLRGLVALHSSARAFVRAPGSHRRTAFKDVLATQHRFQMIF